jgi:hypothetical protein
MSLYSAELMEDVGRSIGEDLPFIKQELCNAMYMVIGFFPKITSCIYNHIWRLIN